MADNIQIVNVEIVDAVDATLVLEFKKVRFGGRFTPATNTALIEKTYDGTTADTINSNFATWKQEYLDGYVSEEDKATQRATDKVNAKAKLIAGEALTEAEADTLVL